MITDFNTAEPTDEVSPDLIHAQAVQQAQNEDAPVKPNESPNLALDIALAPFRGAEDAVRNTYNLFDFLTADALPNYDHNFLGKSTSGVGSVVEGVSQFLVPFLLPGAGALSLASKAGTALGITSKVAAGMAAGAAVDFTAFSGHEDRLSNLLRDHAGLKDPITAYLAAAPDDTEIEGRTKNMLEGMGVGAATEGLMKALTAVKAGRLWKSIGAVEQGKAAQAQEGALRKSLDDAAAAADTSLNEVRTGSADAAAADAKALGTGDLEVVKEPSKILPPSDQIDAGQAALAEKAKQLAYVDASAIQTGGLFQNPEKNMARMFEPGNSSQHLVSVVNGEGDIVSLLKLIDNENIKRLGSGTTGTVSGWDAKASATLADLQGLSPDAVARTFKARGEQFEGLGYSADAALSFTLSVASEVKGYAKAVSSGSAIDGLSRDQMIARALKGQQLLSAMSAISKGYGSTASRVMNARKYIAKEFLDSSKAAASLVADLGGSEFAQTELNKIVTASMASDPKEAFAGVIKLSTGASSFGDRLFRAHNEYWLNAILSGSKTSLVNILGNSITALYQPAERALGSAFAGDMTGVRSSLANYQYLWENIGDAWKFAKQAWTDGDGMLFGNTRKVSDVMQNGPAIDASKVFGGTSTQGYAAEAKGIASGDGNLLSHLFNFVGENVRLPQRFLMTSDEFFKQINYRAAAKTSLYDQGIRKGLNGEALAQFIGDRMEQVVTDGGRRFSEGALYREGLNTAEEQGLQGSAKSKFVSDYVDQHFDASASALRESGQAQNFATNVAEEATFTRALGQMGTGLQRFSSAHPLFQLILPFVRTPTNIIKYFGERGASGLQLMPGIDRLQARNLAELAHADPLIRQNAMGRMAAGNMFVAMTGAASLSGAITGSGPSDPKERALLEQTGWQARSIKIETADGPHYYSYDRIDPFATFLGVVADTMDLSKRQDPHHLNLSEGLVNTLATSFTQNVTNKSYMQSLAKFIDMVQDPERRFASWSRSRVASYIPTAMAQFNTAGEDSDTLKEIRSNLDAVMGRIPGLQGKLETKRNLLGEPIEGRLAQTPGGFVNPVTLSHDKNDPVFNELAKFGHGLDAPNSVLYGKIPLLDDALKAPDGSTAYDQYQQNIGQVTVQGKTLRESLAKLIDSKEYKRLPEAENTGMYDTPRLRVVKSVISAYRQAALAEVQKDNPALKKSMGLYYQDQVDIARGREARGFQAFLQKAQ